MHSTGYFNIIFFFWFLIVILIGGSESISSDPSAQSSLDSLLQEYAFKELINRPRTKTGIPYDVSYIPSNMTGIEVSALMLTRYSLKWKGYGYFKDIFLPPGIMEEPYVRKLVMVYQNLGNWSSFYYPLPGYTYLTPVLGIFAYDAHDLYATDLPELDIIALEDPITVRFPYVQAAPDGSLHKCVYFYMNRWVEFGNVTDGNLCLARTQGHFSIVVEEKVAPSPAPTADDDDIIAPSPSPSADDGNDPREKSSKMWTVLLVFLVFALFGVLFFVVKKLGLLEIRERSDDSAAMVKPLLGNTEVALPVEASTRPLPENDYVP